MWSFAVVLFLLFVIRFFARRAKKRLQIEYEVPERSPQAKRHLKAQPCKSCHSIEDLGKSACCAITTSGGISLGYASGPLVVALILSAYERKHSMAGR
jgi:hypothetical protein